MRYISYIIILLSLLALASCQMQKRVYKEGFYVDWNDKVVKEKKKTQESTASTTVKKKKKSVNIKTKKDQESLATIQKPGDSNQNDGFNGFYKRPDSGKKLSYHLLKSITYKTPKQKKNTALCPKNNNSDTLMSLGTWLASLGIILSLGGVIAIRQKSTNYILYTGLALAASGMVMIFV